MSVELQYQYPGDPLTTISRMTVDEFLAQAGDRAIVIESPGHPPERIPVNEVVCDTCNAGVSTDPATVALVPTVYLKDGWLYCEDCAQTWIVPYLLRGQTKEAP